MSADLDELGVCPSEKGMIGKGNACQGCPGQQYCLNTGGEDPDQKALDTRMSAIDHKILVMSGKGGVGKSTIAAHLAIQLAKSGFKVGIMDVDICGPSIPRLFNVENATVINQPWGWIPVKAAYDISIMSIGFLLNSRESPVLWRGPRKTSVIKRFLKDTFWGKLDYLIIDTPPGTSDEHLSTIAALKNAKPDGGVIVTTPQEVSLSTIRKEITFCEKVALPIIGIVENMSGYACPCCDEVTQIFPDTNLQTLLTENDIPLLSKIPIDPSICLSGDSGDLLQASPSATSSFESLSKTLQTLLETGQE